VSLTFALLSAAAALGQPIAPWDEPAFAATPARLLEAAQAVPSPPGTTVQVLLFETEFTLSRQGVERYRERQVYRLLHPQAVEGWSRVEADWSPWYQERPVVRARVVTAAGAVHTLDPTTLAEGPRPGIEPDIFIDERRLRGPLPAVAAGAVVELEITIAHREPLFPAGETRRQWLALTSPVHRARVILEAPDDLPLRHRSFGLAADQPTTTRQGGRLRHRFEARDLAPVTEIDAGLPPEVPLAPFVAFSTGESWSALARAYGELVDRQLQGADLAALIPPEPAPSQWDRIAQLLAAVRAQVRYTGIQFDDGGIVPKPPAETLARRYGDCKDQAVLLLGLLRQEGIPAYLALLNAGVGPDIDPELPGLGLFNHAIVYVPGASPLWLDPTDPYTPLGSLPLADHGRHALIAAPNTQGLLRTPEATAADHRVVEEREVYLAEYGTARVVEVSRLTGGPAREIRASWHGAGQEEIRASLEGYVRGAYGAHRLVRFEQAGVKDLAQPLALTLEAERASFATTDRGQAVVVIPIESLFDRLPEELTAAPAEPSPRRHDYLLYEPHQVTWHYRIHVPEGLVLRELPESREQALGAGVYRRRFAVTPDGRQVTATFELDSGPRRLTPEQLAAARTALAFLPERQERALLLWFDQTVEQHLAAGRIEPALAEARRLIELHPREAFHRGQLARTLVAAGLGEEARRQGLQAVTLEPAAAVAHQMLAWTLIHDPVGRPFAPGFDRAAALAAYREAHRLDPDDAEITAELAILLEHDERGRRYADRQGLDEAIELYRSVGGELDGTALENNLLIALFWAERLPEVEQEFQRRGEPAPLVYLQVVAAAARRGAESAVAEAARRVPDPARRLETLAAAGRHLLLLRRYPEAADLFAATARLSSEPASLLSLAETLRKTRREAGAAVAADSPEELVRSLFRLALGGPEDDLEPLLGLFASPVLAATTPEERREAARNLSRARHQLEQNGMPREVALDLLLASLEVRQEGDDASGYRVRTRSSLGGPAADNRYLVVREPEGYRLAASDDELGIAGFEVLRRVEAGDLAGAARWLTWADEELPAATGDPLGGSPARRFWKPGDPQEPMPLRLAGAALLCLSDTARVARPILEEAPATAAPPPARDLARALCASKEGAWPALSRVAPGLLAAYPDSRLAWTLATATAIHEADPRWLETTLQRRLEAAPADPLALEAASALAMSRGQLDQAAITLERLLDGQDEDAEALNDAAWVALLRGDAGVRALGWARQAAERSGYRSYPILHTLAALYAEQGQAAEAHRVLLQGLSVAGREPEAEEWYVLGRLAEHYQLPEVARGYYRRVTPPEDPAERQTSTWQLSQRRLAALGG
jgi:transglutaminase-like putative cysteine protease/tetratricopeptide (TPR) repeat protein